MKTFGSHILVALILIFPLTAASQAIITEASAKYSSRIGLDVTLGAEYRTADRLSTTDRWSIDPSLSYKLNKYVRFGAGYSYIRQHELPTDKVYDYWTNKHRAYIGVTGSLKVWKFTLSLRERYQYTHRCEAIVPRWDKSDRNWTSRAKDKHILRSRFQIELRPAKKSPFMPYAAFELYSLLGDTKYAKSTNPEDITTHGPAQFADKFRVTAGCPYKINKHNTIELYYRYTHLSDPDDIEAAHSIGIAYSFKL